MIKRLLFAFFVCLSFLFLFTTAISAETCSSDKMGLCKKYLGNPDNKCCRENSCSSKCAVPLNKWEYCYADACCYGTIDPSCGYFWGGSYYCDIRYRYEYKKCLVTDSCRLNTPYLYPGICDSTGCTKGGNYKICCRPDGSSCTCINGNNTGTCPSGCPHAGSNVTTCPTPATSTPTPTPRSTSTPTPTPTPTSTPTPTPTPTSTPIECTPGTWSSSDCRTCNNEGKWNPSCTDYGDGPIAPGSAWCACELKCKGSNPTAACQEALPTCVLPYNVIPYNNACPSGRVLIGGCCVCPY